MNIRCNGAQIIFKYSLFTAILSSARGSMRGSVSFGRWWCRTLFDCLSMVELLRRSYITHCLRSSLLYEWVCEYVCYMRGSVCVCVCFDY